MARKIVVQFFYTFEKSVNDSGVAVLTDTAQEPVEKLVSATDGKGLRWPSKSFICVMLQHPFRVPALNRFFHFLVGLNNQYGEVAKPAWQPAQRFFATITLLSFTLKVTTPVRSSDFSTVDIFSNRLTLP